MVAHLILFFGLLCAGAFAGLDSWDSSDEWPGQIIQPYWTGFIPKRNDCNECLKTVAEIKRLGKTDREINGNYHDFNPCQYLVSKRKVICTDVLNFVSYNLVFNFLDNREICAKSKYCTMKYNSDKTSSGPVDIYYTKSKGNSGLERKSCRTRKDEESTDPTVSEALLDLSNGDRKCDECLDIVNKFKEVIGNRQPKEYMLFLACLQVPSKETEHCFNMIDQNVTTILQLLTAKKSSADICININDCPRLQYAYCRACRKYVYQSTHMDSDDALDVACAIYSTYSDVCKETIQGAINRIFGDRYPNELRVQFCRDAGLCPSILMTGQPQ